MGMFDPKALADSIVEGGDPEAAPEGAVDTGEMTDTDLAAEDVLAAFAENDPKALATALKAIFDSFESKPHAEAGEE
jgi:hypothetical protein